jgi:hypothetical protein
VNLYIVFRRHSFFKELKCGKVPIPYSILSRSDIFYIISKWNICFINTRIRISTVRNLILTKSLKSDILQHVTQNDK